MDSEALSQAGIRSLTRIGAQVDRIADLERGVRSDVEMAREQKVPWRMIGVALGTSTQAAWERYRPAELPKQLPGQGGLF